MDKIEEMQIRHSIRVSINDALEGTSYLKPSRELSLTITKLEEALMWTDKIKMQEES